ncbi:hypothetical protein VPH5P1C_0105 [Vibrio phage 5P1c]
MFITHNIIPFPYCSVSIPQIITGVLTLSTRE